MKKSLFAKVYEVVAISCKPPLIDSKNALIERVSNEGLEIFQTWFYNEDLDEMEEHQSLSAIRNAVNLAIDINLLTSDGKPTKAGERCFSEELYSEIVSKEVISKMNDYGISIKKLNQIIHHTLKDGLKNFPTSSYLHTALGEDIAKSRFSRYLSLLQSADVVEVCSKKLYLGFHP